MKEQSLRRKHGGDIWGAFGSSLGSIQDGFESHVEIIQAIRRHPGGPPGGTHGSPRGHSGVTQGAHRGHPEAPRGTPATQEVPGGLASKKNVHLILNAKVIFVF